MTNGLRFPTARLRVQDAEVLEQRARSLSGVDSPEEIGAVEARMLVAFRLDGSPCALEIGVLDRVVARLGPVIAVAGAGPDCCGVAFVDGRPLAVLDLRGAVTGTLRRPDELRSSPALLVAVGGQRQALAVEAPVELAEAAVEARAQQGAGDDGRAVGLIGLTRTGLSLIDSAWLRRWVASRRT